MTKHIRTDHLAGVSEHGKIYVREDGRPCYYFGGSVFVPAERGRWLITDLSVLRVDCAHCKQKIGHACTGARDGNLTTATHHVRRRDAQRRK